MKMLKIKNRKCLAIIENLLNIPYKILFLYARRKERLTSKKKYYFSVCCIFKDEAKYLGEWIEYNRIIGVDHIYMYNNNSTDDFRSIIDSYNGGGTLR